MRLATTTADFCGLRGDVTAELVYLFAPTGFRYLDYSFYHVIVPDSPFLLPDDGWKRAVYDAAEAADACGLRFVQAHAPDGEHFLPGEARDALLLATRRAIEACGLLGIPDLVVHAAQLADPAGTPEDFVRENIGFYRELLPTAETFGVRLLTENSCEQNCPRYYLRSGAEMRAFLDRADHPLLGACWDTGHAHIQGVDQYESIRALGDRLRAVHIQDNFGGADEHIAPLIGSCPFDPVMRGLLEIGYPGCFTLEADNLFNRSGWPHRRAPWRENDRLRAVPEELRQQGEQLLYALGKWMLTQYDCFEA